MIKCTVWLVISNVTDIIRRYKDILLKNVDACNKHTSKITQNRPMLIGT